MSYRTGSGIDFHQLKKGKDLWIGGVKIPHSKGAVGHSDADVLLHAICDALLGALALGDIGIHFPDNSYEFKNIASSILLQRTMELIKDKGYIVVNIDSTVCLEEPKIKPYAEEMRRIIAGITNVTVNDISVKATTTEKMGFTGKGKGIMAYATVLLMKKT
jgi:2-C-methyl-D-erythritol 2,4-cyclodiphosphate synthase